MSDLPLPEPPEPNAAARSSGLQRMMPLLTLVIAVVAIGLAVWEGLENRRYNRLTVQPRLGAEVQTGRDDRGRFIRLSAENTGLGPAVVSALWVYLDGRAIEAGTTATNNPWSPVIEAVGADGMRIDAHAFGEGYFFPAGRQQILFELHQPDSVTTTEPLTTILDRIAVQICYCSVYGSDCNQALLATVQVGVRTCPT